MSSATMIPVHTPKEAMTQYTRFQECTQLNLDHIEPLQKLTEEQRFTMQVVANVLPFRVNNYVINELIQWDNVPDDPVFQLTFPQRDMLAPEDFERMATLLKNGAERSEINALATEIRAGLNPHPAGQQEMNVPQLDGEPLPGVQHKNRETVLFFPSRSEERRVGKEHIYK